MRNESWGIRPAGRATKGTVMAAESCIPVIPSKDLEKSLRLRVDTLGFSVSSEPAECCRQMNSAPIISEFSISTNPATILSVILRFVQRTWPVALNFEIHSVILTSVA